MGMSGGMKRSLILGASLLCLVSGQALADNLEDALVAAYNSNPDLRAERANLRSIDENVAQAISGWRPTLSVDGSIGKSTRRSAPSFGAPTQDLEPFQGAATVTQPVFTGFQTLNSFRQSQAQVRAGRANLISVEQQNSLERSYGLYGCVARYGCCEAWGKTTLLCCANSWKRRKTVSVLARSLERTWLSPKPA